MTPLFSFRPYGAAYTKQVFVAASTFNADDRADIVTSNVTTGPTSSRCRPVSLPTATRGSR